MADSATPGAPVHDTAAHAVHTPPPLSRYLSRGRRAARFVAQRLVLGPFLHTLARIEVRGRENVARGSRSGAGPGDALSGGYVLVSNHSSHLDAALLATRLPWSITRDLAFGAAADYFFDVAWRRAAAGLFFNTFPIDRTGGGSARGMAFVLVDAGVPIALFPEGTRSRDGSLGVFTPGAALVARRERVPTVPVAIIGAHAAMPPGAAIPLLRKRLPVALVIGRPVPAHRGERIPDYAARVEAIVRGMLETGTPWTGDDDAGPAQASRARADRDGSAVPGGRRPLAS